MADNAKGFLHHLDQKGAKVFFKSHLILVFTEIAFGKEKYVPKITNLYPHFSVNVTKQTLL
jgi:hypothetical protein